MNLSSRSDGRGLNSSPKRKSLQTHLWRHLSDQFHSHILPGLKTIREWRLEKRDIRSYAKIKNINPMSAKYSRFSLYMLLRNTVNYLIIWTDRPEQTMQIQIRLLPKSLSEKSSLISHIVCQSLYISWTFRLFHTDYIYF